MTPQTRSEQAYLDHLVETAKVVNIFWVIRT
jgi:hypothetical protein